MGVLRARVNGEWIDIPSVGPAGVGVPEVEVRPDTPISPETVLWYDTDEVGEGAPVPAGGTTGQLLTKTTDADYAYGWSSLIATPTFASKAVLDGSWLSPPEGAQAWTTAERNLYLRIGGVWRFIAGDNDPTYVHAVLNASQTVSNATWTNVLYIESTDFGNNYVSPTYTVPRKGVLSASAALCFISPAATDRLIICLFINGGEAKRGTESMGSTEVVHTVSGEFPVNAGDIIEVRGYATPARNFLGNAPGSHTWASFRMIP